MFCTDFNKTLFNIQSADEFNECALELFHYQLEYNNVYREFLSSINCKPAQIQSFLHIPCLPISAFKNRTVLVDCQINKEFTLFTSSGTTGNEASKHYVPDIDWYESIFTRIFKACYGNPKEYRILALLPSYLERTGSSLVFMAKHLIDSSNDPRSGFYLDDFSRLYDSIMESEQPVLLLGVSFALLDFAEWIKGKPVSKDLIVMETGGMKGRREELTRAELHRQLIEAFQVELIHSEYGMTELMSQAYSKGNGIFQCPPWMKVITREVHDPMALCDVGILGKIKIIDLANSHSCAFIESDDLGVVYENGDFEVKGRLDNSDLRGCNLLML